MRTVFLALLTLLLSSGSALAAPFDNIITHNAAVPEQSFQIAATWFLPDWQASTPKRTNETSGGGDTKVDCANYTPTCTLPKVLGGKKVRVGNIFCSVECVCPSSYQYTSENCSDNKKLSGEICNGKYNQCLDKTCTDYNQNYLSSRKTDYYCPKATNTGSLTCYTCSQTCENKYKNSGYNKDVTCAKGQTTTSGTDGCSAWILCTGVACPEEKSCTYGCSAKNDRTECGETYCTDCEKCKSCDNYTLDACPDGAICESCVKTCDSTNPTKHKITDCETGYKFYNETCLLQTAMPILYGDKTVADVIIPDKTPLGIVFDPDNTRAVGFKEIEEDFEGRRDTLSRREGPFTLLCSPTATDCDKDEGFINTYGFCTSFGIYNLERMADFYPAYAYACEMDLSRKNDSIFKAGRWYVPSLQELRTIYNQLTSINLTLDLLKKPLILAKKYGSSTGIGWRGNALDMESGKGFVFSTAYVRPVINYTDSKMGWCIDNKYQLVTDEKSNFSCNSNKKQVFCRYDKRFFKCENLTCEEQGKKTCKEACIDISACCEDSECPTGQSCQNGTCASTETCKNAIETQGGILIESEADLVKYGPTGGNLYVSDSLNISAAVTLKNVVLNNAFTASRLCKTGSLTLKDANVDGTLQIKIPFNAQTLSGVSGSAKGVQLETTSNITVKQIKLNSGSENSLKFSNDVSATVDNIISQNYSSSSVLNLHIYGGSYNPPNIGTILVNGYSFTYLHKRLNICSISLSNSGGAATGPSLKFQGASEVTAKCLTPSYNAFVDMTQCGKVAKKCTVYFGPGSNAGANSCTVDFNGRWLDVNNAVGVAHVIGTVKNVSSWGIGSGGDTRYITEFLTYVNGLLRFSNGSSVSGGSMCQFTLKYSYNSVSSVSNSSQLSSIQSGGCNISKY